MFNKKALATVTPDVRLIRFRDQRQTGEPVLLTIVGLLETLLIASDFDEAKVNHICKTLDEFGFCHMSLEGETEYFEICKIMRS